MTLKFEDVDVEKAIIAYGLKGPEGWKELPEAWFKDPLALKAYQSVKRFHQPPYSMFPSLDVVVDNVDDLDVKLFIQELSPMIPNLVQRDLPAYVNNMYEMYAARSIYDISRSIPNDLERKNVSEIIKDKVQILTGLVNPLDVGQRERGFIYETAKARWQRFTDIEANPNLARKIPFGIEDFDNLTGGGLGESHMLLLFAETGGFKTKSKANLAYNMAFQSRKRVMVMTLEVPMHDYGTIIDSRHAGVDFTNIMNGQLLAHDREKLRYSMMDLSNNEYPFYIVDIPDRATSADIIRELELYKSKYGDYPEVLFIDYANEMDPVTPWGNTSEKFKNLGVEFRRISRTYGVRIVTSMQMNREGKKAKEPGNVGLEHMSESHYFSNVFHIVVHLYQDPSGIEEIENILNWSIKKNRYGRKDVTFQTFANPSLNYIGDRKIKLVA